MEDANSSSLQEALEIVESLSTEEQITLVEVISRRLTELRQREIAENVAATLEAIREMKANYGDPEDLINDLLSTR